MREAKLRGLGVAIAVEMFNSIVLTNPDLRYHLVLLVPVLIEDCWCTVCISI